MRAIKAISFIAMSGASYAVFATALIWLFPIYPDPEIKVRVQLLLFELAGVSFAVMLGCHIVARRTCR